MRTEGERARRGTVARSSVAARYLALALRLATAVMGIMNVRRDPAGPATVLQRSVNIGVALHGVLGAERSSAWLPQTDARLVSRIFTQ